MELPCSPSPPVHYHCTTAAAARTTGLALFCVITAALLPYVSDLISLVGALLTMSMSLIIPGQHN